MGNPITLDFSKAQPLPLANPNATTSTGVTLDLSKAQPSPPQKMIRAMQQTMGGPPMFVDVPESDKAAFEQAGQSGYQKGAATGSDWLRGPARSGLLGLWLPPRPQRR